MSDIVKKPEVSVMPTMPMLPELITNALPPAIPQMDWSSGFISDWRMNWKAGRMEKFMTRKAGIAAQANALLKTNLDTMQLLATFGSKLQLEFMKIDHEKEMLGFAKEHAKAGLVEVQLKNMLLQNEVQISEIERQIKTKEMEDLLGITETKDRHD